MELKKKALEIVEHFKGQQILITSTSDFFGQKSKRRMLTSGKCQVVLVPNELYSEMIFSTDILRIPITSILKVDITKKSFLGGPEFNNLLIVYFLNESGKKDSAGWLIPHLDSYKRVIDELRMGKRIIGDQNLLITPIDMNDVKKREIAHFCPFCGKSVPEGIHICENCGSEIL